MNLLKAFSHRPFSLLWSGQTISRLGDNLYRIALAWWMLEKTGSAAAMGTVLIFTSVPMLIFLLVGGAITDRLPRLRIMLISDILSGVVISFVTLLALTGWLEVWHIYVASILFGLVKAFFQPAYTATVPQITPKELLPSANSLTSLSQQGASIIGPAIAASIVAVGGTPIAFGLDALSFFISAACIYPIFRSNPTLNSASLTSIPTESAAPAGSLKKALQWVFLDIREGFKVVITSPWLWITITLFGFINASSTGPMSVALPFLVKINLNQDVAVLGLFTSMTSAGYVIGALYLGRFTRIRFRGLFAYLSTMMIGLSVAIFGLTSLIPLLAMAAFMEGVSISFFSLIWINSLQELVPGQFLGRVSAIDSLGSFVLLPIGYGVAGWATDLVGAPLVFGLGGAITIFLALLGLLHPAIRGLD